MALALRRNILLFHLGALGDFVVTWPLALALARIYPQSRLFYVTHGQKGALAEKVLRVESADVETGGWHALYSDGAGLSETATRLLAGAHTVVSFVADPDGRWLGNVRAIAPEANVVTLSSAPPDAFPGHVTDYHLEQLKPWPAAEEALRQILRSVASRGVGVPRSPAPDAPVVIHPGAGAPRKCWPADHFLDLARRLRGQEGRPVRVLLGEAERERWGAEVAARFAEVAQVRQPATLLDLLGELSPAAVFVGNDSGPGHLAGALGVPTVCLFGPASNPTRWRPLGPHVTPVLADGELDALPAERVEEAIHALRPAP